MKLGGGVTGKFACYRQVFLEKTSPSHKTESQDSHKTQAKSHDD